MAPITNAIPVVRTALYAALSPLVSTYLGIKKVYFVQAAQGAPLPFIIYQPQSNGEDASFLNGNGYQGLWTIRAMADTQGGAETLLNTVVAPIAAITTAGGYSFVATFFQVIVPPPLDGVWQSGLVYRVRMFA
jgi:hypothetical protein